MTRTMRKATSWLLPPLAVGLLLLLAGCGGKPDAAACEKAMREVFSAVPATGTREAVAVEKPAACDGITDRKLEAIVREIKSATTRVSQSGGTGPARPVS